MKSEQIDLVVLGGGPGGAAAAFHAADLGKQVALVEQEDRLGGVCLLRGCIPSKAMIHAGETFRHIKEAEAIGITVSGVKLDMKKVAAWRDGVINELAQGIEALCKPRGIKRFVGRGTFTGPNNLQIAAKEGPVDLRFKEAIIATGSRPVVPPPFQLSERVMTSDKALSLDALPESLLVVGGGYIGLELGTCLAALGAKVTIVELMDRLLMGTETDLVSVVSRQLKNRGVTVHLESKVVEAKDEGSKVRVKVQPKEGEAWTAEYDKVLVAIGRRPNTEDVGLDKAGVKVNEKGFIPVNAKCQTAVPHLFAIGDCTGNPMLAHRSRRMGVVAAEVLAGKPAEFDNRTIPAVVYSDPEIAYCGLSEDEAKKAGYNVKVGRFRFAASGRAKTLHQTDGLVIVVAEEGTEVVLGVRMAGPNVSELLGEAVLAVETGAVLEDLIATIHSHPTLSEAIQEAAEAVRGHAIHTVRPARPGAKTAAHA
jgi:dihydrolipoamide dehydrogenase